MILLFLRLFLLRFPQFLFCAIKFPLKTLHYDLVCVAVFEHFVLREISH